MKKSYAIKHIWCCVTRKWITGIGCPDTNSHIVFLQYKPVFYGLTTPTNWFLFSPLFPWWWSLKLDPCKISNCPFSLILVCKLASETLSGKSDPAALFLCMLFPSCQILWFRKGECVKSKVGDKIFTPCPSLTSVLGYKKLCHALNI